jgi:serine/threonine-protein phosphatase 2A regulatory subunit B'
MLKNWKNSGGAKDGKGAAGGNEVPQKLQRQSIIPQRAQPASGGAPKPPTPVVDSPPSKDMKIPPKFQQGQPQGERQRLFLEKLEFCAHNFGAMDDRGGEFHAEGTLRDAKKVQLMEIIDHINTTKGVFNTETYGPIIRMISRNLFRGINRNSASARSPNYDPEEEEPVLEAAWPHLQYVYEFLLRFVVSGESDPKATKQHIDQQFLLNLLALFDSEDPRERDYLKTILHRIYGKFMPHRQFIRKAINQIFWQFIYETERHNGIAELLEILGSIINGFALPLKDEHKLFLHKALLPLHKVHHVSMYHQQLSYCVTQFVEKDPTIADSVLTAILTFWPRTYAAKEVLFLNEVEEILEMVVNEEQFSRIAPALFERIALCISSPHFQVAERALFLWNNEYIVQLIAQTRSLTLPIVIGALTENKKHWNNTVNGLNSNVSKLFKEMDGQLYGDEEQNYLQKQELHASEKRRLAERWASVERQAGVAGQLGKLSLQDA